MHARIRRTALAAALLPAGVQAAWPGPAAAQQQRLSPLDSVAVTVDGAEIEVQYGRPSMRGRTVFGGLVPWEEVWRTGANEATHLRTSADLAVGDATIPAGHYTLYTIPARDGWTLILNRQTGQWGTEYDPARDLVRLPMRVDTLEEPVETFTIEVGEGGEGGGVLALHWETTRAWLPFQVAAPEADG